MYTEDKNLRFFREISRIPRKSFHEKAVVDYIQRFAEERGLTFRRDALHNIILWAPATPGREGEAPLMLQAHTDMVCAKEPWSTHDFLKDPIELVEEDGWLRANGTTLGADDGAGVANILAILDEPELSHPPLECVFTVQEEDGMGGAKGLDVSPLKSRRMLGLDGIQEGTTIYSASAVRGCHFSASFPQADSPAGHGYRLTVTGLTSGHGALMIGAERANAIKVTARLLRRLAKNGGFRLHRVEGGGLIHVIPRDCVTVFAAEKSLPELEILLSPAIRQLRLEYAETDPDMDIRLEETGLPASAMTAADSGRLAAFLDLLPVGAWRRDPEILERVRGSFNLSILRLADGELNCDLVCRSNYPVSIDTLEDLASGYAEALGITCRRTLDYAGYHVPKDSPLIRLWADVWREKTGGELGLTFMHSALDAGTLCEALGIQDMIVMMPTTLEVHTPRERMDLASYHRTYECLKEIVSRA